MISGLFLEDFKRIPEDWQGITGTGANGISRVEIRELMEFQVVR